jgi:hypothetical protein
MAKNVPARDTQALRNPLRDTGPDTTVDATDTEKVDDAQSDPIEADL